MQVDADFSCTFGNLCVCVCAGTVCYRDICYGSQHASPHCALHQLSQVWWQRFQMGEFVFAWFFFIWTVKCWEIYNISLLAFCQLWLNNNKNLQNVRTVWSSGCHEYISSLNKVLRSCVFFRAFHTKTISSSQLAKEKKQKLIYCNKMVLQFPLIYSSTVSYRNNAWLSCPNWGSEAFGCPHKHFVTVED